MNILIVAPKLPSPTAGPNTRNFHLLKTLASRHNVSLLAFDDGTPHILPDHTSILAGLTDRLQIIPLNSKTPKRRQQLLGLLRGKPYMLDTLILPEAQQVIDALFASHHYDAVLYESMFTADYILPEDVMVIIDQHNIEFELRLRTYQQESAIWRKWYNWCEGHMLKSVEIERCRRADSVLVTSERECDVMHQLLPQTTFVVVPNGVDSSAFYPQSSTQEIENSIVFTGAMDYYPNVDAVCFFAEYCWPIIRARIPAATWKIVGKNPMPEVRKLAELPGVTVTGTVPDTRPYLAAASVAIAPLRIGSGTRLKILEAFAMQKAVISTGLGCEGLAVENGQHLLVADQPELFAQSVIRLLEDGNKRRELGCAGRSLVETTYDWEQSGKRLLQLVDEMEPSLHGR